MDTRTALQTVARFSQVIGYVFWILPMVAMTASINHDVTSQRLGTFPLLLDEPFKCESEPFVVIFVHSGPGHRVQRDTIRQTWGSVTSDIQYNTKVLFIIGLTVNSSTNRELREESIEHHDILQINIMDTYGNLTLKSVAMLNWAAERCPDVSYVIKTDDDTFLNTPLLIQDLRSVVHKRFMMGDILAGAKPIRDKKSKYFTPISLYNDSMYPTYLSGAAYVISGDIIPSLSQAAEKTELFWLEDVYITGLLAHHVRAKHVYNGKFGFRIQSLRPCQLLKVIALHRINSEEMTNAWNLLKHDKDNC